MSVEEWRNVEVQPWRIERWRAGYAGAADQQLGAAFR